MAGKKLSGAGVLEPVAPEEFLKFKAQLGMTPATNFYTRWAKWFCADRATRTISPLSSITVPEYVQQRIAENNLESLREAVRRYVCISASLQYWMHFAISAMRSDPGGTGYSNSIVA